MTSRGYYFVLAVCILLGFCVLLQAKDTNILKRAKRKTPTVYDIYALDHFIELVEKIEKNVTKLYDVATYIRQVGYDNDYWTTVIGTALPLPSGILSRTEINVLRNMVAHRYDRSREVGVILTPAGKTIAIGHVINGICAGMARDKQITLAKWSPGAENEIDNLYAATISRDVAQAVLEKKNDASLPYFGPGGSWDDTKCPEVYTRSPDVSTGASDAELLGDIDGFLLGYYLPRWVSKGVRLGQLLRMYYSTGVCYDVSVASCKRYSKLKSIVDLESLQEQVTGVAEAFYLKNKASYPNVKKEDIPDATNTITQQFYPYVEKINGPSQICPEKQEGCELSSNLVFVMDESGSIGRHDFEKEKQFVRQIIDAFNISPRQTNVAVVEFSSDPDLAINLQDYESKTRLSCAINDLHHKGGKTHMEKALRLVKDQVLLPIQRGSVPGRRDVSNILIFLTDGQATNRTAFVKAVQEIKEEVKDLTMLAVGVSKYIYSELQLVATDPQKHVFTASNFDQLLGLVKELQNRTCKTPSQMDVNFNDDENNTFVTAYVSPGGVRYFTIAPKYIFGLSKIYIEVKPLYGSVVTYASRTADTPGPGNYTYKLDPIPVGQALNIEILHPCLGYNISTCPPIYLAIWGKEPDCTCIESECTTLNQIKFTIRKGGLLSSVWQSRGSIFLTIIGLILSRFSY